MINESVVGLILFYYFSICLHIYCMFTFLLISMTYFFRYPFYWLNLTILFYHFYARGVSFSSEVLAFHSCDVIEERWIIVITLPPTLFFFYLSYLFSFHFDFFFSFLLHLFSSRSFWSFLLTWILFCSFFSRFFFLSHIFSSPRSSFPSFLSLSFLFFLCNSRSFLCHVLFFLGLYPIPVRITFFPIFRSSLYPSITTTKLPSLLFP